MNLYLVFHYRIEHDFIFDYEMTERTTQVHTCLKSTIKTFRTKSMHVILQSIKKLSKNAPTSEGTFFRSSVVAHKNICFLNSQFYLGQQSRNLNSHAITFIISQWGTQLAILSVSILLFQFLFSFKKTTHQDNFSQISMTIQHFRNMFCSSFGLCDWCNLH